MADERIGFIGLGDIGAPMAMRLLDAGFALNVYNRTPEKTQPFIDKGAAAMPTPAELARHSDIVLLCLTDGKAVEQVVFGPNGVVHGSRPGQLLVDLSTIHALEAREMAARLRAESGIAWLDAPVSGGIAGARAGTLAVMAGGDAQDVERARPIIMHFAGRLTHMGPSGSGQAAKSCNQIINCGTAVVVAEALTLAARFDIDPLLLIQALAGGLADSNVLQQQGPKMATHTFSGNTRMTQKDIEIVMDLGRLTGSPMPVASLAASYYRMLIGRGLSRDGFGGVMRMYAEQPLAQAQTPAQPSAAAKPAAG